MFVIFSVNTICYSYITAAKQPTGDTKMKYFPTFRPPTAERIAEINRNNSIARQEYAELLRQSGKQNMEIFAGRLIEPSELNAALDANS